MWCWYFRKTDPNNTEAIIKLFSLFLFVFIFLLSCGDKSLTLPDPSVTGRDELNSPPTIIVEDELKTYRNVLDSYVISYKDKERDLAISCKVHEVENVELESPCACDSAGKCKFTFRGSHRYSGPAKVSLSVTDSNSQSSVAELNIGVNPIGANDNDEWVKVEGPETFYVMKYEAKKDLSSQGNLPKSNDYSDHWLRASAYQASEHCRRLGDRYDLISENEWIELSRLIVHVKENWSANEVGVGSLKRVFATRYSQLPFVGPDRSIEHSHLLPNGSRIFDLAGNHWEWVDWVGSRGDSGFDKGPECRREVLQVSSQKACGGAKKIPLVINLNHNDHHIGMAYGGNGGGTRRGGELASWAGLFAITTNENPGTINTNTAFRCVFR